MAASKKTLTERQFQALVNKFKTLQKQAASDSVEAGLKIYWSYGNLISELRSESDIGYHNSLLQDLARETSISLRILQQSFAFRKAYKKAPAGDALSWSHYRVLTRLPSEKQRAFYSRLAKKESWTSKELQNAISSDLYSGGKLLDPTLPRPSEAAFLYRAERVHVVDGDTLDVMIDLGFRTYVKQRLRLARINASETTSAEGRAARSFLSERSQERPPSSCKRARLTCTVATLLMFSCRPTRSPSTSASKAAPTSTTSSCAKSTRTLLASFGAPPL